MFFRRALAQIQRHHPLSARLPCTTRPPRSTVELLKADTSYNTPLTLTQAVSLSSLTQNSLEAETGASIGVSKDGGILNVKWQEGPDARFHGVWLRHNCHCDQCRAPAGQRKKNVLDYPETATISDLHLHDDYVALSWYEEKGHVTRVPLQFLRQHCYSKEVLEKRDMDSRPKTYSQEGIPQISLKDVQNSQEGLLRWLEYISDYGMCLVKDIPTKPEQIAKTFQVVNEPDPINIAYSVSRLNLHMDLLNYESPPGLQLLHCLSFDSCVTGGGSHLLDVFHVAERFRESHPQEFRDLARIPATFQRIHFERENPVYMTFQRPHILLNHRDEIAAVFWTQQNEGPLAVAEEDVEAYYRAYRLFAAQIRFSDMLKCVKLEPGDAIVFNNRRVLHGREEFTLNGGRRHLEGCYVNIDEFKSHYRCLSHALGRPVGEPARRVGNQCWF
ncbi:probable gamma-butyrobetaine dioxygenase [Liolophura sinensis]|uniref:probable gamma-butyrobetaine dioxygenase n=1 Tax=Liolophura sinensis TaxID=3198878 RepID=UPI0031590247